MSAPRRRFVPESLDGQLLEPRVVLSAGLRAGVIASAPAAAVRARPQTAAQKIDAAFTAFTQDYSQVRALYFGSITEPATPQDKQEAFQTYTAQRVNLLAQDLVAALRGPGGGKGGSQKGNNLSVGAASVVYRKINGRVPAATAADLGKPAPGTLLKALSDAIPPADAVSAQTTSFYTLAQDSAIAAAPTIGDSNQPNTG